MTNTTRELLAAANYMLGILESISEPELETIQDILDEDIDFEWIEAAISRAEYALEKLI